MADFGKADSGKADSGGADSGRADASALSQESRQAMSGHAGSEWLLRLLIAGMAHIMALGMILNACSADLRRCSSREW
jgi:hypothetical protein